MGEADVGGPDWGGIGDYWFDNGIIGQVAF